MKDSKTKAVLISATLFTTALLLAACDDKAPKQSTAPLVSSATTQAPKISVEPVTSINAPLKPEEALTEEMISGAKEQVNELNKEAVDKIMQTSQGASLTIDKALEKSTKIAAKTNEISTEIMTKTSDISDKVVQLLPKGD